MLMPVVVALGLLGCSHGGSERNPSPTQATQALPDSSGSTGSTRSRTTAGLPGLSSQGYAFPPARGARASASSATGVRLYAIARGDGNAETAGTWKRVAPDTLEVKAAGGDAERLRICPSPTAL
jgi:hypothetical protein